MCGIVSIAGDIDGKAEKAFKHLLILDSLRGEDSTGVLSVAKHMDNDTTIAKQVGDPFMLFDHKSYDKAVTHRSSRVLLGHNRYATTGVVNRANAHPFEFPSVIGVHNGTLTNKYYYDKENKFAVDSEALYNCIDMYGIDEAIKHIKGAYALVYWDRDEKTINYLRNKERPLWFALNETETLLFAASEAWMINIAAGRNDIKIKQPVELEVDTLLTVPVAKGGKLGHPIVREVKPAPLPAVVVHTNFPKGAKTHTGTNQSSPVKAIVKTSEAVYDGSKMDMQFMNAKQVGLEAVAMMKDKHQAEYMLCFCPEKPFYEIRLYRSVHSDIYNHAGCEFLADISSFTSVSSQGAGYYKVSPHRTNIQTYLVKGAKVEEFPTHDGKYLRDSEWRKRYGDCSFCNCAVIGEDLAEGKAFLTNAGDSLCKECSESDDVKPYVQLVNI